MSHGRESYDWMRETLDLLFASYDVEAATKCLRDELARNELRRAVNRRLQSAGKDTIVPLGERGDNLLQAILALRIKFPREEATAKLELNIAMREQHRGRMTGER
ncbi:MAG TPA: hypothetical protein VIL01_04720 [Thermomicrobiales bacterium]